MNNLFKISKPILFLNKERVVRNIETMYNKAKVSKIRFRPHFKTHQSIKIGKLFREFGVTAITVSSLDMALYFARDGWKDITVAFPVNILEIDKINFLSSKIILNILVDSKDSVILLSNKLTNKINVFIKVDTGYRRAGIYYKDLEKLREVIRIIKEKNKIKLKGLLSHFGHTYYVNDKEEIKDIYYSSVSILKNIKSQVSDLTTDLEISIGDTPSCSVINRFKDVDEIRPGNFVFYDFKMLQLGVCNEKNFAIAVGCPIVSIYRDRKEAIAYCGAIHLSKDSVILDGKEVFGIPVLKSYKGWGKIYKGNYVKSLSQEHGILKLTDNFIEKIKIGDIIFIIPVHSCLTADAMKSYVSLDGKLFDHM